MVEKPIKEEKVDLKKQFQKYSKKMLSLFDRIIEIVDNNPTILDEMPQQLFELEYQSDAWLELVKEYYDTHPEAWEKIPCHAGCLLLWYEIEKRGLKDPVDPQKSTTPREKTRNCIIDASAHRNQGEIIVEIKMTFTPVDKNGESFCLVNFAEFMNKIGDNIRNEGFRFDTEEGQEVDELYEKTHNVPQDQSVTQAIMTRSKE